MVKRAVSGGARRARILLVLVLVLALPGVMTIAEAADAPWVNPFAPTGPAPSRPAAAAQPRAAGVHVDRESIGLGESVSVTVLRDSDPVPLDLSLLQAHFEVRDVNRGEVDGFERWLLTLYPRSLGRFALPDWNLGGPPATVAVSDGSATAPRVRLRLFAESSRPLHERQSALLTLEACSDGALQWQRPRLSAGEAGLLRPLGQTETQTEVQGLRCTATRWQWALLPTAAGSLRIRVPMLEASRFGEVLRLPGPQAELEVAAVPRWLPAEIPVGPLAVELEPGANRAARVGEPWRLQLRVKADLPPDALRRLLQSKLAAAPHWLRYPIEITPAPGNGAVPAWRATLHATPQRAGTLAWPALDWSWFDPDARRLKASRSEARRVAVDDPARRHRLQAIGVVAGAIVAAWVAIGLWRRTAWRWRRRRLVAAIRRARTPAELRDRLLAFQPGSPRGRERASATLGDWWQAFAASRLVAEPAPWLPALQRLIYSADAPITQELPSALRDQVLEWLWSVAPRRRAPRASAR